MRSLLVISLIFLAACSEVPRADKSQQNIVNKKQLAQQVTTDINMDQDALLFYLLRKAFIDWKGTPYRLGGNSKQGIDCSAFVQNVYRASFNITLPRTTEVQAQQGYLVYRDQLQVGDLLFFKTGWRTRHVGIYIGNEAFIHASTSQGVISSSLKNVYWKQKYWQAKRILN